MLRNEKATLRREASDNLADVGAPAVEPLIAALKDKDQSVRSGAADALGKIGDPADSPLLAALKSENLEVIAGAYAIFIRRGAPGSEDLLVKALDKYGKRTPGMAQDFLDSGNALLSAAAKQWLLKNGPVPPAQTASGGNPRWGIR